MPAIDSVEVRENAVTVSVSFDPSTVDDWFYVDVHAVSTDSDAFSILASSRLDAASGGGEVTFTVSELRTGIDTSTYTLDGYEDAYTLRVYAYSDRGRGQPDDPATAPLDVPPYRINPSATYQPDCKTDSRVYVNGQRLPSAGLDLYMRKEGPIDVARYVEGEFASPFHGTSYTDFFQSADGNQRAFDVLRVELKDYATDDYYTAFHGVVTGLGNTAGGPSKLWKYRAQGPAFFLSKVPASKTFRGARAKDVLQYVADELQERLPYAVEVALPDDNPDTGTGEIDTRSSFNFPILGALAKYTGLLSTPKAFKANTHQLADVLDWLGDKVGMKIWLEPTQSGVALVATDQPTMRSHEAHYLDGDVYVVNNDALIELRPANTLVVKGAAKGSKGPLNPFGLFSDPDTYVKAKARHRTLYERAGETELHADTESLTDAQSSAEVKNEAKSRLKSEIGGATTGDMQTLLAANVRPFDTIEAQPTCDENVSIDASPITYEVDRVHHEVRAGVSTTTLNVGVHAALDEVEIVDTWVKDT